MRTIHTVYVCEPNIMPDSYAILCCSNDQKNVEMTRPKNKTGSSSCKNTKCECVSETDGNISIVSKRPNLSPLVSVLVSIEALFEYRYQSRYRSRGMYIFCMVLAEFLLNKVSVSVSVPVHFPGISISISLDSDQL